MAEYPLLWLSISIATRGPSVKLPLEIQIVGFTVIIPMSKALANGKGVLYFAACTSSHEASLYSLPIAFNQITSIQPAKGVFSSTVR